MRKIFNIPFVVGTIMLTSQALGQTSNIEFVNNGGWNKWQQMAKREGKHIFIDLYATWCEPCKQMDKEVFTNDTLAEYMNSHFISVRLQVDTTINDNSGVRHQRKLVERLKEKFEISGYPSFLFADSEGNIVHKAVGYMKPAQFLSVAKDADIPERQFYGQLEKMRERKLDRDAYPQLTGLAKDLVGNITRLSIPRQFVEQFANQVEDCSALKKQEWLFIAENARILKSTDKAFKWCIDSTSLVDSLVGRKIAKNIADNVINREIVQSEVSSCKENGTSPDWDLLEWRIITRFGSSYVNKKISSARIAWLKYKKYWTLYTRHYVDFVDIPDTSEIVSRQLLKDVKANQDAIMWKQFVYNNIAWEVFLRADVKENKPEMIRAISWIEKVLKADSAIGMPQWTAPHIDTKANLLYKLGRIEEAIAAQAIAIRLSSEAHMVNDTKTYSDRLDRMRQGVPTWDISEDSGRY